MQTSFSILKICLLMAPFFCGCRERLPGEDFAVLPKGDYPKLGYVPMAPALPDPQETEAKKQTLIADSVVSEEEKEDILNQIKMSDVLGENKPL